MLKKEKVVKLSTLDAKLWKMFSEYVRLRDRFQDDWCKCISCGCIKHWKEMHAGHFIDRQHKGVKFNEQNVHAQCCHCNTYGQGEQYRYGESIIKKYGSGIIDELYMKKKFNANMCNRTWYEEMIVVYSNKLKNIRGK